MDPLLILSVVVLIISVSLHEFAHGYAAYLLGDPTAKYEGRLTANPLKHLDPVGSVLIPAILVISNLPAFGWAKPVPYNPYNLRNRRWGELAVAAAGPASNVVLALVFAGAARAVGAESAFFGFAAIVVVVNLALALFNLIPVPPLDGSKIFAGILGERGRWLAAMPFSLAIGLAFVAMFVIWPRVAPVVYDLAEVLLGR